MRSFVLGLVALPAALGLAVPFPMTNGTQPNVTQPLPPGPTGTGVSWVQPPPIQQGMAPPVKGDMPFPMPNGTQPHPPGPTSTGAAWVQFQQSQGDIARPVKRDTLQLNEKRFFPMPNGTQPQPPSPSGTGAPWVQLPPANEEGQEGMAPPVEHQLNELKDIIEARSDSLPVNVADLKNLPKIPKEFIPSMPIPVPSNGTWPIINGTFPPFNSTVAKPPVPLSVPNLRN